MDGSQYQATILPSILFTVVSMQLHGQQHNHEDADADEQHADREPVRVRIRVCVRLGFWTSAIAHGTRVSPFASGSGFVSVRV